MFLSVYVSFYLSYNGFHSFLESLLYFALPDNDYLPPSLFKKPLVFLFIPDISIELILPEFGSGFWRCCSLAFFVPIPEAAMYENHRTGTHKRLGVNLCSFSVLILDRVGCSGGAILNPSSVQQIDIILSWRSDTVLLFIWVKWLVSHYDTNHFCFI